MINGNHFSLILLSTNQCNAACDYCFEDKTRDRLTLDRLQVIIGKVLDHMDEHRIDSLSIHWQGGEAMLLSPRWYRKAFDWIREAADKRGKRVEHGLQTNMLAYTPEWDSLVAEMFGNSVSTSLDYPNLYRKVRGQGPEHYDALWASKVRTARANVAASLENLRIVSDQYRAGIARSSDVLDAETLLAAGEAAAEPAAQQPSARR